MPPELRDLLPHLLAMFVAGLLSSFGLGRLARMPRGRAVLRRLGGGGLAVGVLVALALGGAAVYGMVRPMLEVPGGGPDAVPSPFVFFGLGLLLGVPLGLPAVIAVWSDARPAKREARRKKGASATKDDRREYVAELVEQIREASPEERELTASIGGDGGRTLMFEGELTREEGERLTEALRAPLEEVGFKRVEGTTPGGGSWWTNV